MNSSLCRRAPENRAALPVAKYPSPILGAALLAGLLILSTVNASANQTSYGFYSEFVGGALADRITQPYYDANPYEFHKVEMRGSMTLTMPSVDLFPSDPAFGRYVDTSGGSAITFQMEGQQFTLAGNLTFDTYVNGSSYLSINDNSFRLSFLFYDANFATDSADNLKFLTTQGGNNDIDLWALSAFGGGLAYSDKAVDIWELPDVLTFSDVAAQSSDSVSTSLVVNVPDAVTVPDTLPLVAGLAPLMMITFIHRRMRLGRPATAC